MENQTASPTTEKISPEIPNTDTSFDKFTKTSTAAKLSGTFNETAGLLKRKLGEFTGDDILKDDGRNQQLLGKVHHLVGNVREIREMTRKKLISTRVELTKVLRDHGGKLLDGVSAFIDDVKKTLF